MAGYVFAISNSSDNQYNIMKECINNGVYSTYIKTIHPISFEGTLADYVSMKPGDNIYFFCNRKYYGIGELVSVGVDCKYNNYISSSFLKEYNFDDIKEELLINKGAFSPRYRWICTFKGSPYFFERGIDVDEILNYKPHTFKMLRVFWKRSFIKIGDEENNSLKEIFLLRHQSEFESGCGTIETDMSVHGEIKAKLTPGHLIEVSPMLEDCFVDDKLKHEMALEAATIEALTKDRLQSILGHWDYISHQVAASPFKPVDYMDKIDVFASRYLPGTKIVCKYLVAELKKDKSDISTVDQVLKYVDWVCNEYAYGDYNSIDACIIAYEFDDGIYDYINKYARRSYTSGSHPINNLEWKNLRLIRYKYINGSVQYVEESNPIGV